MSKNLMEVLGQIKGGQAITAADQELLELVRAVRATGKKGSITLKIDIEPDKDDDTVLSLQPSITVKKPVRPYAKGLFYDNQTTGELTREDPRQLELLKEQEAEREAKQDQTNATTAANLHQIGRGPRAVNGD